WENQVARGRPFWEHFFPFARQVFPTALGDVRLDDFHFAVNCVEPSLIRVSADQVTYDLHILVRVELEQALIAADLPCSDIPAARLIEHATGTPPNHAPWVQGLRQKYATLYGI